MLISSYHITDYTNLKLTTLIPTRYKDYTNPTMSSTSTHHSEKRGNKAPSSIWDSTKPHRPTNNPSTGKKKVSNSKYKDRKHLKLYNKMMWSTTHSVKLVCMLYRAYLFMAQWLQLRIQAFPLYFNAPCQKMGKQMHSWGCKLCMFLRSKATSLVKR